MDLIIEPLTDLGIAALLFVGLVLFRSPKSARAGNLSAAGALLLAVAVVLLRHALGWWGLVVVAALIGSLSGWAVAARTSMIQIPALVAFQHGAGAIAAFIVSYVELLRSGAVGWTVERGSGLLGLGIGAATFSASLIASGKLAGVLRQKPVTLPAHSVLTLTLAGLLGVATIIVGTLEGGALAWGGVLLIGLATVLGLVVALRIGGADMPVLISVLNASAGLAAALCGVILGNRLLVACGSVVTASGSMLTLMMCRAMNRSLLRVFTGLQLTHTHAAAGAQEKAIPAGAPQAALPQAPSAGAAPQPVTATATEAASRPAAESPLEPGQEPSSGQAEERPDGQEGGGREPEDGLTAAVEALHRAGRVVIVPGYGMALAQAQFEVVRLAKMLEERGAEVSFAIHPVAGRMPGHMNVLLAEAEADYEQMLELDDANLLFGKTDVVLVVGACDVINPAAVQTEDTPISGMPILNVSEARRVVVCNLDARPGYSGVDNLLYQDPRVVMLLGDARQTVQQISAKLEQASSAAPAAHPGSPPLAPPPAA